MKIKTRITKDKRGELVSVHFPGFTPKNIYWITGKGERGGHAHKRIRQVMFCIKGSIKIRTSYNGVENKFVLNQNEWFFLDAEVFAWMDFKKDDILMVMADDNHDQNDCIQWRS